MINFPNAPIEGDIFTYGSNVWIYHATNNQWQSYAVGATPGLALVATTGSYTDLTNKPQTAAGFEQSFLLMGA